jgi:hypothetical protein
MIAVQIQRSPTASRRRFLTTALSIGTRPFEAYLPAGGPARFKTLTWEVLLVAIERPPDWLVRYAGARGYSISTEGQ